MGKQIIMLKTRDTFFMLGSERLDEEAVLGQIFLVIISIKKLLKLIKYPVQFLL